LTVRVPLIAIGVVGCAIPKSQDEEVCLNLSDGWMEFPADQKIVDKKKTSDEMASTRTLILFRKMANKIRMIVY
jgi:hypothetical protein